MRYAVMYRGQMTLRTNNITEARAKLQSLGDTAYIQYSRRGREAYQATHDSYVGEEE